KCLACSGIVVEDSRSRLSSRQDCPSMQQESGNERDPLHKTSSTLSPLQREWANGGSAFPSRRRSHCTQQERSAAHLVRPPRPSSRCWERCALPPAASRSFAASDNRES